MKEMNIKRLQSLPPTPHYPNWRYLCPHCLVNWEIAEKFSSYLQPCSDCILKMIRVRDFRV